MSNTIGVDVGGTKIAAGVVADDGSIVERVRRDTPAKDADQTAKAIVDLVRDLRSRHDVAAVGIGAAGFIGVDRSTVLFAANLAWRNEPLGAEIAEQVAMPVIVENDVSAAAWGEFRFGAGADADDLLMVAVGTGVGGGVVTNGDLMRGAFGVAGEIGHMRVVPQGLLCGCGRHGCWEQYASGRALVREARHRVMEGDGLLDTAGGDLAAITGPMITQAAQDGDLLCIGLLEDLGRWLGEGIATLSAILDPGLVVIGGGVSEAGQLLMRPVEKAFDDAQPGAGTHPRLEFRLATLGNEAGLIGSADLARKDL